MRRKYRKAAHWNDWSNHLNNHLLTVELAPVAFETSSVCSLPLVDNSACRTDLPHQPTDNPAALFPMPLAAFEEYLLVDDQPDFPITFFIQLRLKGGLNLSALVDSIKEAARRHPLFCCRVERRRGRYWWVWSPETVARIELNPDVWRAAKPWMQPINLFIETGVNAWAEITDTAAEITLQIHHACCDGIGASQFLEDISVCYARRTTKEEPLPELRTLRPEGLLTRSDAAPRRIGRLPGSLPRRLAVMLRDSLNLLFLGSKEALKAMPADDSRDDTEQFNLQSEYLERAATRRLRNAASRANVTLNDILVRDLMETLDEWNRESGGACPRKLICVLIPTSLRGPADDQLPAANVLGYLFLGRKRKEMLDSRRLLADIGEEMSEYVKAQHGWLFVQGLQSAQRIPYLVPLSSTMLSRRCMSTAVLSHMGNRLNSISSRLKTVGDVIHVGNMTLDEIRCVPPMRYGTHVTVGTYVFGSRLMVNLRCDPVTFGVGQTRQFLDRYIARLKRTAEEG
jgi:hypothetical protein